MTKATKKETPEQEVSTAIVAQETAAVQVFDIQGLIAQAIEKNTPVETMERLLAIAKDMKAEWAKEQFTKAMAAFQAECPTIEKTKEIYTNDGKLAYKYAPLESIVEQVKEALQRNGFSYSTNMELLETGVKVFVKATHISGHSEVTEMNVPLGGKTKIMSDTQQVAAAQTFAKRYAFCNAFGILTGDEDTDGATQDVGEQGNQVKPSDAQIKLINDLKLQKNVDDSLLYDQGFDMANLTGGRDGTASELITFLKSLKAPGYGASPLTGTTKAGELLVQDFNECDSLESGKKIQHEFTVAKEAGNLSAMDLVNIGEAAKAAYDRLTNPKQAQQEREYAEMAAKIDF